MLEVNFRDLLHSDFGYNPLRFVRWDTERGCWNEQDILTISAALVPNEDHYNGSFWENAARMMLDALISYTLSYLPQEEHNLVSVSKLFAEAQTGVLDELMKEVCTLNPDSFTATRWKYLQSGRRADKMYGSVFGIVAERLSIFSFSGAQALALHPNQIDFAAISHEPTAVFLKVSDSDFSLARLTSLFYTQALQMLIAEADARPDNRLHIPVRLYWTTLQI